MREKEGRRRVERGESEVEKGGWEGKRKEKTEEEKEKKEGREMMMNKVVGRESENEEEGGLVSWSGGDGCG